MSAEEEMNLRIAGEMMVGACAVLKVRRYVFLQRAASMSAVVRLHAAAMNEALSVCLVPMAKRRLCVAFVPMGDLAKCPFFRAMVEFYVERGRRVIEGKY